MLSTLCEILTRLIRIETRLMRIAEALKIDLKDVK